MFNFFLFHSNKLANEKVKLEDRIKKSQDDCQERVKRAVKAEVQTKNLKALLLELGSLALIVGGENNW